MKWWSKLGVNKQSPGQLPCEKTDSVKKLLDTQPRAPDNSKKKIIPGNTQSWFPSYNLLDPLAPTMARTLRT